MYTLWKKLPSLQALRGWPGCIASNPEFTFWILPKLQDKIPEQNAWACCVGIYTVQGYGCYRVHLMVQRCGNIGTATMM